MDRQLLDWFEKIKIKKYFESKNNSVPNISHIYI